MAFFSKSDGKGIDRYFIELDDTHKHWLLYKWPDQAIRTNTRLTVDADYHAVFTNRGTVIATLEPGAHVLNNGATPVISSIADALTGGKHSDVELFFVSTKLRPAVPFVGPVDAVAAHDLIMDVRVFGDVTYHISDPQTFVTRMAGTAGNDIEPEVNEVVRAQVLAAIREEYTAFTADGNVLASGANQDRAEELVIAKANATLADIGIAVEHFGQLNINIDPTDLATFKQLASRKAMVTIAGDYEKYAIGEALMNVGNADGPSSNALLMAQMIAAMNKPASPDAAPPAPAAAPAVGQCRSCHTALPSDAAFCPGCGTPARCPDCSHTLAPGKFCPGCVRELGTRTHHRTASRRNHAAPRRTGSLGA